MLFDHRIASDRGASFVALDPAGAETILHITPTLADRPVVGDWVAAGEAARIVAIAPRRGVLARARHDRGAAAQAIAANLDVVFVVTAPGREFSPARVERYLVAIRAAGARAVVVLNKCDLARDPAALVAELYAVTGDVPVVAISAEYGDGCAALDEHVSAGATLALVGSSGVGKSTLANRLLGAERFATRATRASDGRGVHTSTRRELVALPSGAWLVDTPGMRAFAPWSDEAALDDVFADVAAAATRCRFRDCAHAREPGCAVRDEIAGDRYARWSALRAELAYLDRRDDPAALAHEKRRWKSIAKAQRNHQR
ncbi:MAG: ribosome biosis GTPase / thiamine phosphate phosphatase [Candidatus Eremiobacteraeota bacterium]|nr:ribosome biosis GTPase / thiamine phosphate phosphatase [Candidatus Eremiobacteraeota bacterium]